MSFMFAGLPMPQSLKAVEKHRFYSPSLRTANLELLHTNKLTDDDMCMATPAIVGDRLLLRTSKRVYCVRQPGSSAAR